MTTSIDTKREQQQASICQQIRRSQLQMTSPFVRTGRESDNHWDLVTKIFNSTAPSALNDEPITKRELADCAQVNAIALSWCIAAIEDTAKPQAPVPLAIEHAS
jgi:hypothetical protein